MLITVPCKNVYTPYRFASFAMLQIFFLFVIFRLIETTDKKYDINVKLKENNIWFTFFFNEQVWKA